MSAAVKGLEAFDSAVQGWFAAVEKAAAEAALGLAKQGFEKMLRNSPQFSGDFASGWGIGYGKVVSNYKVGRFPGKEFGTGSDPFGRGDEPAMTAARAAADWHLPKLGESIYISNDAQHDEPYAWKIENGEIAFRTPNMGADHLVEHAVKFLGRTFPVLGKSQLEALKGVGA